MEKICHYKKSYRKKDGTIMIYDCRQKYNVNGNLKGRPPSIIPQETINKIIQMCNDRHYYSEIAIETGLSHYMISKVLSM